MRNIASSEAQTDRHKKCPPAATGKLGPPNLRGSMVDNLQIGKNGVEARRIEEISQIIGIALGEGAAACEACGEKLREGAPLVVFAFRPANESVFEIGHVKCTECRHEPTEYFTLGVRELVADGRVGRCTDQATQSSWPVLLAPRPRAVSPADTTTVHPLPGTTWFRRPIAASDVFATTDCATTRKPWQRPVVPADSTDRDSTPEPDSKSDDTVETSAARASDGGRSGGAR